MRYHEIQSFFQALMVKKFSKLFRELRQSRCQYIHTHVFHRSQDPRPLSLTVHWPLSVWMPKQRFRMLLLPLPRSTYPLLLHCNSALRILSLHVFFWWFSDNHLTWDTPSHCPQLHLSMVPFKGKYDLPTNQKLSPSSGPYNQSKLISLILSLLKCLDRPQLSGLKHVQSL